METKQLVKIVGSGVVILIALILIGVNLTGGDQVSDNDLRRMVEALPDDELLQMRQSLAAQIADANRRRTGEKSEMLLGYERQLADYDKILEARGIDTESLVAPSIAEVPIRKDEGP